MPSHPTQGDHASGERGRLEGPYWPQRALPHWHVHLPQRLCGPVREHRGGGRGEGWGQQRAYTPASAALWTSARECKSIEELGGVRGRAGACPPLWASAGALGRCATWPPQPCASPHAGAAQGGARIVWAAGC